MSLQRMNCTHGYLELYLGPMWSGKTSELVKIYKRSRHCDIPILAINFIEDNRYTFDMITTHDNISIPCVRSKSLSTISDITKNKVAPIFDKAKILRDKYVLQKDNGDKEYIEFINQEIWNILIFNSIWNFN